jgi:hypothetical protein
MESLLGVNHCVELGGLTGHVLAPDVALGWLAGRVLRRVVQDGCTKKETPF